jgi:hypothetical protein
MAGAYLYMHKEWRNLQRESSHHQQQKHERSQSNPKTSSAFCFLLPPYNQSLSPLRVFAGRELRGRERVGQRSHGLDLHLQRGNVVGRLLEQRLRGDLPAAGDEAAQHAEALLHLPLLERRSFGPAVVAPDLASGLDEHAASAGGEQDGAAPARLAARGERERRISRRLDGPRTAAGTRGAERVEQAAPVYLLLRARAPLALRWRLLHFPPRRRGGATATS